MDLSALQQEFLDDHRKLTAGLRATLESLESGDLEAAVRLARELDREAGAHMAFEEEVFYPRLARVHGQAFVDRMISEHETGQRAVNRLLALSSQAKLSSEERDELLADLHIALGHVLSCGTMLSELDSGERQADDEALERLRRLRVEGERWSDRSYSR